MTSAQPKEDAASLLAIYLIDLRAQYEANLRILTNAQRYVEQHRAAATDDARRQFKHSAGTELRALQTANTTVRDARHEAMRQVEVLAPKTPAA